MCTRLQGGQDDNDNTHTNFIGLVFKSTCNLNLPGFSAGFHGIGQGHVIGPDVVLPFAQSQDSAEDASSVNANSHV